MKKLIALIGLPIFLVACNTEPNMDAVMGSCEGNSNFNSYVSCIKTTYKRDPNARAVRAFYAQLDAISDDLKSGKVSEARARADAHMAYEATIGVANTRLREAWDRQQAINSMNRTINCYTIGNQTTCD